MMKGVQFSGSGALAAIDRMEEKVLALEAEAESTAQVPTHHLAAICSCQDADLGLNVSLS